MANEANAVCSSNFSQDRYGFDTRQPNTAEIYAIEKDKILKLFNQGFPKKTVLDEYKKNLFVQAYMLPVPAAYDFVETEGRYGIIYDRIKGKNLFNI